MKKSLAALALAALSVLATLPPAASAADLAYTYGEVAYSKVDTGMKLGIVGFSGGQGYELGGAYALGEHWFLEGDYRYNNFRQYDALTKSTLSENLTPQSLRLGGGYHTSLGDSMDLLAHLDYGATRTQLSQAVFPNSSTSDRHSGYLLGLGLRIPTDLMEIDLGLDHDNLGLGQVLLACTGPCGTLVLKVRQGGTENVFSAALRHDFGPVTAGVEYRRSSFQGWRDLLVSLRMTF